MELRNKPIGVGFAIALALLVLPACGLIKDTSPTPASSATVNALQAIIEAIADVVLPPDVAQTSLPFGGADAGSGLQAAPGGAGSPEDFVSNLLGGAHRMAPVNFDGLTTYACRGIANDSGVPGGLIALTGVVDVSDGRDVNGNGLISIQMADISTELLTCLGGNGYASDGTITASASDSITVSGADPIVKAWSATRSESAGGSMTIVQVGTNTTHEVTFTWSRYGTLGMTVDNTIPNSPTVTVTSRNQTVTMNVNGQGCVGTLTSRLFNPYDWDCDAQ